MKKVILLILLALSFNTYAQSLSNHYRIDVAVKPSEGYLKVNCKLDFIADKPTTDIVYWLNSAFQPIEVTSEDVDSIWFTNGEGFLSHVAEVHIRFKDEIKEGGETKIHFTYEGTIQADQFIDRGNITPAWTELSVGAMWYPVSLEESWLTYDITLTAPSQYEVISAGEVIQQEETKWRIHEELVTPGRIIVMLSDQLHRTRTSVTPYTVDFYVLEPDDPLVDSLQQYTQQLLTFFDERFGAVESKTNHMKIFFPNRDIEGVSNGGFSANGKFIMLNNGRNADAQYDVLSHEIAHFWWRHGTLGTYHDFLNEGLAEFSKLLARNEKYGDKNMQSLTNYYREQTKELGSIKSWDIQNLQERHLYLYWKGSLVMADLLNEAGEEKVYAILKRTSSEKISRYEEFLQIVEEVAGSKIAEEFDQKF
ncbi:hypothetical protein [Tunicatimonas pelagia]|uniref:hypothetical protein n=1 Tax=Tunicatimonas pelagia TaxID=931531 RepID=UPI002664EA1D|nr:hypothetical protein [Tunicatimonas pelagia]WKN41398.1 hypothetical protein P0M28_20390 [Tunicatimonas pelagia]